MTNFNLDKFNPAQWHFPHWWNPKNNQETMIYDKRLSDKLVDGKTYRTELIREDTGEKVTLTKLGQFRRFSYNEMVPEAKSACKEYVRQYESGGE